MKHLLTTLFVGAVAAFVAMARPDVSYTTQGQITVAPQIDALIWTNRDSLTLGSIDVEPALFFETQNTRRFVNLGLIQVSPGIRFETISDTGLRSQAVDFINRGEIQSPEYFYLGGELDDPIHRVFGGRISIWSENITSPGYITGLHAGLIDLKGENVDLTRGGVGNDTIYATVFFRDDLNLVYNPEIGFTEDIWGYFAQDFGPDIVDGDAEELVIPSPGDSSVTFTNIAVPALGGFYQTFVRKQTISTNVQVFDIAFVSVADPENVLINVSWIPGANSDLPPVGTAQINLKAIETNVVRGLPATNQVTFYDSFGARPAEELYQNILSDTTFQPTNMFAIRGAPFFRGSPTNFMFFSSGGTNTMTHWLDTEEPRAITNYYPMDNEVLPQVPYCIWGGNIAWQPSIPIQEDPTRGSLTNIGGRVSINANNLTLNRTRIQGQGAVTIQATNLVSAERLVVDTPILSLNLGSAINDLKVRGFAAGSAKRMGGDYRFFSILISNTFSYTFTNAATDPTQAPTTEDVDYVAFYHITVLDTSFASLRSQLVEDVKLTSDKVTISDPLPISRDLLIDAEELVLDNRLSRVDDDDVNLLSGEFPRLKRLEITENGSLSTRGLIEAGDDGGRTIERIANAGEIRGTGVRIRTAELENSGRILAAGGQADVGGQLDIAAAKITGVGGTFSGLYGLSIRAGEVQVEGATISSPGDISLDVGTASFVGSELITSSMMELVRQPDEGSLGGLKLTVSPRKFEETLIVWSGQDLGPTAAGFSSGGFLGELSLETSPFSGARLKGSGTGNAMYVGLLSLSDDVLSAIEDYLQIDSNLTVYFSATSANVPPEVLDGFITANGGKLVYVPTSAGGDGIVLRAGVSTDGASLELSWDGAASTSYRVESRGLNGGSWTSVGEVKNTTAKSARLKLNDSLANGSGRLYRVVKGN